MNYYTIKYSIKTGLKIGNISETLFKVAEENIEVAREAVRQMARAYPGSTYSFKVKALPSN